MKKFLNKYRIPIIFFVFFLIVLIENQFMWLYHDDYGYASLSYAYKVQGVAGHTFSFSQLLDFLIGHYNNWGGRILYFAIECLLLEKSIVLYRFVQSIVITLIVYYIYKITKKHIKIDDYILAILSTCCYGFIEIMVVRTGIFWPTASVLYVFPLLPLLMFIYYYDCNKKGNIYNIFVCILIFFATFSQEQIAVAALSYVIIYSLNDLIRNKKINKKNILIVIISLIGFAILMLSPGSKVRMNHPSSADFYQLSMTGKIIKNYPELIINIFSHYSKIFVMLLLFSILYLSIKNYKNKKNVVNTVSLLSNCVITFLTMLSNGTYFEIIYNLFSSNLLKLFVVIIFSIQLLLMIYSILIYYIKINNFMYVSLVIMALLSQAAMIMAPYYPLRSVIVFEILLDIIIIDCICDFIKEKSYKNVIVFSLMFISLLNLFTITSGYYRNDYVNKKNNEILINSSIKIKSGEKINKIKLKKLPDLTYSGEQPYIGDNDYINQWIIEYYDLPENIKIMYE